MARTYARRDTDQPEANDLRARMAANRRRRQNLESQLERVRSEAAMLAREARGVLTYDDMAERLGVSRAQVGNYLQTEEVPARAG